MLPKTIVSLGFPFPWGLFLYGECEMAIFPVSVMRKQNIASPPCTASAVQLPRRYQASSFQWSCGQILPERKVISLRSGEANSYDPINTLIRVICALSLPPSLLQGLVQALLGTAQAGASQQLGLGTPGTEQLVCQPSLRGRRFGSNPGPATRSFFSMHIFLCTFKEDTRNLGCLY